MRGRTLGGHLADTRSKVFEIFRKLLKTLADTLSADTFADTCPDNLGVLSQVLRVQSVTMADTLSAIVRTLAADTLSPFRGSVRRASPGQKQEERSQ